MMMSDQSGQPSSKRLKISAGKEGQTGSLHHQVRWALSNAGKYFVNACNIMRRSLYKVVLWYCTHLIFILQEPRYVDSMMCAYDRFFSWIVKVFKNYGACHLF